MSPSVGTTAITRATRYPLPVTRFPLEIWQNAPVCYSVRG
jgi:hypothetical protein